LRDYGISLTRARSGNQAAKLPEPAPWALLKRARSGAILHPQERRKIRTLLAARQLKLSPHSAAAAEPIGRDEPCRFNDGAMGASTPYWPEQSRDRHTDDFVQRVAPACETAHGNQVVYAAGGRRDLGLSARL